MYPSQIEGNKSRASTSALSSRSRNLRWVTVLSLLTLVLMLALSFLSSSFVSGQAGRRSDTSGQGSVLVSVVARREKDNGAAITSKQVAVFDNGVQQDIKNFSRDPSPARIVLLVDNSLTLRADIDRLEDAAREFA